MDRYHCKGLLTLAAKTTDQPVFQKSQSLQYENFFNIDNYASM